jgi:hypothetical protein
LRKQIETGKATGQDVIDYFARVLGRPDDSDFARSDYKRTIEALEAVVERDRILYLFGERLFDQAASDRVSVFLGISSVQVNPELEVNKGVEITTKPDPEVLSLARKRLAPVYDFVHARFGDEVPASWMKLH